MNTPSNLRVFGTGGGVAGRTLRSAIAVALVGMALVAAVGEAAAFRTWCRSDPVVAIDGQLADIFVSAPEDAPLHVTGPNQIKVTVPAGVAAELVLNDLGFGKGTEVTFAESRKLASGPHSGQVRIDVYVPADIEMPVRVEFAPNVVGVLSPAAAEGMANAWVSLWATLASST